MPTIELVYDADCPNAELARQRLREALSVAGHPPEWVEWERSAPECPAHATKYGSPTILVDGADVAGADMAGGSRTADAQSCRVYASASGLDGAPSVDVIAAALAGAAVHGQRTPGAWLGTIAGLGVVGSAALPVVTCPACWPAYAGLLSALGVGFLTYTPYLLPAMAVLLAISLISLGYRAKSRRGYGPLLLGAAGGAILLAGGSPAGGSAATWAGAGLLLAASAWNAWPARAPACHTCATC